MCSGQPACALQRQHWGRNLGHEPQQIEQGASDCERFVIRAAFARVGTNAREVWLSVMAVAARILEQGAAAFSFSHISFLYTALPLVRACVLHHAHTSSSLRLWIQPRLNIPLFTRVFFKEWVLPRKTKYVLKYVTSRIWSHTEKSRLAVTGGTKEHSPESFYRN